MRGWGDIGDAVQAAQKGSVLLPPTVEVLPEEQAWKMIAAEGGGTAALLFLAVTVIWRKFSANQAKQELLAEQRIEESRVQNKQLVETQAAAIIKLSDAMIRVEGAVRLSDVNNQHAIGRLSETVTAATTRLDRHEAKLETTAIDLMEHSHRIKALESGSHRVVPPSVPGRGPRRNSE